MMQYCDKLFFSFVIFVKYNICPVPTGSRPHVTEASNDRKRSTALWLSIINKISKGVIVKQ